MDLLHRMRHGGRGLSCGPPGSAVFPGRPGVGLLLFPVLLVAVLQGGCAREDGSEGGTSDPYSEVRERLDVDPRREIHEVTIGGRGDEEHVVPTILEIPADAIVVFTTVDGRVHTVSFPEDSLALDAALFLERTAQMRSPPLVDRGSRFVLTFEGAPGGRYRFRSEGPGGEAWGTLVVGDSPEAR